MTKRGINCPHAHREVVRNPEERRCRTRRAELLLLLRDGPRTMREIMDEIFYTSSGALFRDVLVLHNTPHQRIEAVDKNVKPVQLQLTRR